MCMVCIYIRIVCGQDSSGEKLGWPFVDNSTPSNSENSLMTSTLLIPIYAVFETLLHSD